jgi:hydroxymethylpyrimidine pyrophosphatase-like HAD family hydrolase
VRPFELPARLRDPIRVLVVDIDGCLVPVEHAAYDLEALGRVAALNRLSRTDGSVPALTILSGRPHPYVDALMQILDIELPAVFENGAGLAVRAPYHARFRKEVDAGRAALTTLRGELERFPEFTLQPGKSASLTVFPLDQAAGIGEIERVVAGLLERHGLDLVIDPAFECVNVLVPGVDKGTGLGWLAQETGVGRSRIAGIGDSEGDLAWLRHCALSGAPANAHPRVRDAVDVVSARKDVGAVLELYTALTEANRAVARVDD